MLAGVSPYVYVGIGVAGLVILGAIVFVVWFRSRQSFQHGAEAEKAKTASGRVEAAEAEVDLLRKQAEIMGRDESTEETARSLDDGTF